MRTVDLGMLDRRRDQLAPLSKARVAEQTRPEHIPMNSVTRRLDRCMLGVVKLVSPKWLK